MNPAIEQPEIPVVEIGPSRGWSDIPLGELWDHRELVYFLAWRSVKSRYRQTVLGIAWAVVQPLFTVLVYTVIFGRLAKLPSDGYPFAVFSLAGLVPWNFFSIAMSNCAHSLVVNAGLIKKVYLPRLAIPVSTVLACVVDLGVSLMLLFAVALFYGVIPGVRALALLPLLLLTAASALGFGLWFAALNVRYRDVGFVLNFVMQIWGFATPVVWSLNLVPEVWRPWVGLNPMAGVVMGFRWAMFEGQPDPSYLILVALAVTAVVLASGLVFFRRLEQDFADLA